MVYSSILTPNSISNKFDKSVRLKINLLMKDENVVVTIVKQKLKFDVSRIERLFYKSVSFFK